MSILFRAEVGHARRLLRRAMLICSVVVCPSRSSANTSKRTTSMKTRTGSGRSTAEKETRPFVFAFSPICASMPWGEKDRVSRNVYKHILERHRFDYSKNDRFVRHNSDRLPCRYLCGLRRRRGDNDGSRDRAIDAAHVANGTGRLVLRTNCESTVTKKYAHRLSSVLDNFLLDAPQLL